MPSILPQVTQYDTSFKVWSALTGIFIAKSKLHILQVKNRLTNFKKENQSVEEYVTKLTCLAEEVWEANMVLDDNELTLIALNDLDASYDVLVTTQTAWADDITFAAFQGLL